MLSGKKLGIIGAGKLGEAIAQGLMTHGVLSASNILCSVKRDDSIARVKSKLGIDATLDNVAVARESDVILLAVKPQNVERVAHDIRAVVQPSQLVLSVAAAVTTGYIEERLEKPIPVVRAMPNTPASINAGMTAICKGKFATKEHLSMAEEIFRAVGEVVMLDESLFDGVTALSASGPAYIYVVIESLAEAGVKLGIPRDVSTLLAAQTTMGAAKLALETKQHPALLKDSVTTPAGTTIDGLLELEAGGLRVTLIKAVVKAAERAGQLVKK
ncbi:MAG: pyrroline-5-carboxylate reductase [[Candidatus Thermochlorobacteriaceae] bacterium GBChlB]|jgi:pyrroline-5-carboxylate reductase|nr:MAG: pyrroline-5-carboxylate reductase [[Candidatus Thermochlorobacteriaceae] bacterium GBChlB]